MLFIRRVHVILSRSPADSWPPRFHHKLSKPRRDRERPPILFTRDDVDVEGDTLEPDVDPNLTFLQALDQIVPTRKRTQRRADERLDCRAYSASQGSGASPASIAAPSASSRSLTGGAMELATTRTRA